METLTEVILYAMLGLTVFAVVWRRWQEIKKEGR